MGCLIYLKKWKDMINSVVYNSMLLPCIRKFCFVKWHFKEKYHLHGKWSALIFKIFQKSMYVKRLIDAELQKLNLMNNLYGTISVSLCIVTTLSLTEMPLVLTKNSPLLPFYYLLYSIIYLLHYPPLREVCTHMMLPKFCLSWFTVSQQIVSNRCTIYLDLEIYWAPNSRDLMKWLQWILCIVDIVMMKTKVLSWKDIFFFHFSLFLSPTLDKLLREHLPLTHLHSWAKT